MLSPITANAVLIEIAGAEGATELWEVTFVEGTFEEFAEDLVAQEWWGDAGLAMVFADAIGDRFGVNHIGLAAYFVRGDTGAFTAFSNGVVFRPGVLGFCCVRPGITYVFAMAERVSVPEPGTLALLGLGLFGVGLSRRRKA